MPLKHMLFTWSWSIFDLEYSSRLLMALDYKSRPKFEKTNKQTNKQKKQLIPTHT